MLRLVAPLGLFLFLVNLASAQSPEGDLTCQSEAAGSEILITLSDSSRGRVSLTNKGKKGKIDCSAKFKRRPEVSVNGAVQYSFALSDFKCSPDVNAIYTQARLRPRIELEIIGPSQDQKGYRAFVAWQKGREKSRCHVLTIGPRFLGTKVSAF